MVDRDEMMAMDLENAIGFFESAMSDVLSPDQLGDVIDHMGITYEDEYRLYDQSVMSGGYIDAGKFLIGAEELGYI